MSEHIGKTLRMSEFIDSRDERSFLFDATVSGSVGAVNYLEELRKFINDVNFFLDGIIVNPGQAEHQADLLGGKKRASTLVRVDWTNVYRGEDFALPHTLPRRINISDAHDVLFIGGTAAVISFFMGYDEDMEADNIQSIANLVREAYEVSIPVVADLRLLGNKINENNYHDSIKLGLSFMMEAGVDAIIIPETTEDNYKLIGEWATIPVLVRFGKIPEEKDIDILFKNNLTGIVLDEKILDNNYKKNIEKLYSLIHTGGQR